MNHTVQELEFYFSLSAFPDPVFPQVWQVQVLSTNPAFVHVAPAEPVESGMKQPIAPQDLHLYIFTSKHLDVRPHCVFIP